MFSIQWPLCTEMDITFPITVVVILSLVFISGAEVINSSKLWSSLSPLELAAIEGRAEDVESILHQNGSDGRADFMDMSPLHWAALRGHTPVILVLLKYGADPHGVDRHNNTALHMAAMSGKPGAVQQLVLSKVNVNAQNKDKYTALHLAVAKEDFEVVKTLLRFGARTDLINQEGRSALDVAVESKNLAVIKLLSSAGAKNFKGAQHSVPAVEEVTNKEYRRQVAKPLENIVDDFYDLVEKYKAEIGKNNSTLLHLAAAEGITLDVFVLGRHLLNLINARDIDGNSPLHVAILNEHPWSADIMILFGADPFIRNNDGKSAVQLAKETKNENFRNFFQDSTLEWFRDVRELSAEEVQLHDAVKKGYYVTVAKKCKEGVDVRVKDVNKNHYTALHHVASLSANVPGTVLVLMRCGADLNSRDAEGNTPLHLAVVKKNLMAFKVLLHNRADPLILNNLGKSAYQLYLEWQGK